jgi:hypothetical protein
MATTRSLGGFVSATNVSIFYRISPGVRLSLILTIIMFLLVLAALRKICRWRLPPAAHPALLDSTRAGSGSDTFDLEKATAIPSVMFNAITKRQSTRADYNRQAVTPTNLDTLAKAIAKVPGVNLVLLTDRPQIARLRELVLEGNSTQMADAAFVRELKLWLRFNPRQV